MANQEIFIIETTNHKAQAKGGPTTNVATSSVWSSVSTETLKDSLTDFIKDISTIFSNVEKTIGNLELKEITVNVGVSGKGKIGIIGSVESGIEGGIEIKLTRKKSDD